MKSPHSYYSETYVPPFRVCFFDCIPVDRAEISHMNNMATKFVPVTESNRLPGSYEEALNHLLLHAKIDTHVPLSE